MEPVEEENDCSLAPDEMPTGQNSLRRFLRNRIRYFVSVFFQWINSQINKNFVSFVDSTAIVALPHINNF
jgi:hypothetical protein